MFKTSVADAGLSMKHRRKSRAKPAPADVDAMLLSWWNAFGETDMLLKELLTTVEGLDTLAPSREGIGLALRRLFSKDCGEFRVMPGTRRAEGVSSYRLTRVK